MPAVRYIRNNKLWAANHLNKFLMNQVSVIGKGGRISSLPLVGFICKPGVKHLGEGGYVRMMCAHVSCGGGTTDEEWIALGENETVLCWWISQGSYGSYKYAVYAIVDEHGWPVVVPAVNTVGGLNPKFD